MGNVSWAAYCMQYARISPQILLTKAMHNDVNIMIWEKAVLQSEFRTTMFIWTAQELCIWFVCFFVSFIVLLWWPILSIFLRVTSMAFEQPYDCPQCQWRNPQSVGKWSHKSHKTDYVITQQRTTKLFVCLMRHILCFVFQDYPDDSRGDTTWSKGETHYLIGSLFINH